MPKTTRRHFIAGSALLPFTGAAMASAGTASAPSVPAEAQGLNSIERDLARYIGFGSKQAGGDGDNTCGDWMAAELEQAGFTIERQDMSVPFFTPQRCELTAGPARAPVWPQPIVRATGPEGLTGPLVHVGASGEAGTSLSGAIALVDLPSRRWSSALAKTFRSPVETAFAAGAKAVVAITNGPTGKIIALNTDGREPMFDGPVALLAPEDAVPFLKAARDGEQVARLYLTGAGGRRPAFNFIGRLDRGAGRWLAVSTPRSGWYGCAGERGPGIAAWLGLARWAAAEIRSHNLAFICNSGHEYQYLGAEEALHKIAPKPEETSFWLHLGANIAARDWHDAVGPMRPLPGADSQRYLVTSPPLLPLARVLFAGQVGLGAPYSSAELSAGELTNVIEAGYRSVAGVFGIHRFHHVREDDARCVPAEHVAAATTSFRRLLEHVLS